MTVGAHCAGLVDLISLLFNVLQAGLPGQPLASRRDRPDAFFNQPVLVTKAASLVGCQRTWFGALAHAISSVIWTQ